MTVGHPHPPEKVCLGVEAWKRGLIEAGFDPTATSTANFTCALISARRLGAGQVDRHGGGQALLTISRIGRRSLSAAPAEYDWEMMLATGRKQLRQSGTVHSEYPQRDEELLFRYP